MKADSRLDWIAVRMLDEGMAKIHAEWDPVEPQERTIAWSAYCRLIRRAARRVGGPAGIMAMGESTSDVPSWKPYAAMLLYGTRADQVREVLRTIKVGIETLFDPVRVEVLEVDDEGGWAQIECRIDPEQEGCSEFFWVLHGAAPHYPNQLYGYPRHVQIRSVIEIHDDHRATYFLWFPLRMRGNGPTERLINRGREILRAAGRPSPRAERAASG